MSIFINDAHRERTRQGADILFEMAPGTLSEMQCLYIAAAITDSRLDLAQKADVVAMGYLAGPDLTGSVCPHELQAKAIQACDHLAALLLALNPAEGSA